VDCISPFIALSEKTAPKLAWFAGNHTPGSRSYSDFFMIQAAFEQGLSMSWWMQTESAQVFKWVGGSLWLIPIIAQ